MIIIGYISKGTIFCFENEKRKQFHTLNISVLVNIEKTESFSGIIGEDIGNLAPIAA
jgi:hypothetical protein